MLNLRPPVQLVQRSASPLANELKFLLPSRLRGAGVTERGACQFVPVKQPLFPGPSGGRRAWTEFRYLAYCLVIARALLVMILAGER